MAIARDCWTGTPAARTTDRYTLPAGTLCLPTPESPIPFLVGGHSPTALRRAGRLADGWLGQQSLDALDPMALANAGRAMRDAAVDAGRAPAELQVVLRVVDSAGRPDDVAAAIPALAAAGVDEIIVNVDWEADAGAQFAAMSGTGS
jgi:alkanesulfonate monooxygenase SsuD/methylene tetrahydromethanopterin reductase-like flavin-dependent oxidoreductase (luciferase family)